MTASQFENFLNKEQRDPGLNELLYPYYTIDKVTEMIRKFETDESFAKKSIKFLLNLKA
jgi:phosphatidylinositol phospholipase C, beta